MKPKSDFEKNPIMTVFGINSIMIQYNPKTHHVAMSVFDEQDRKTKIDLNSPSDLKTFCMNVCDELRTLPYTSREKITIEYPLNGLTFEIDRNEKCGIFKEEKKGRVKEYLFGSLIDVVLSAHELIKWCERLIASQNAMRTAV